MPKQASRAVVVALRRLNNRTPLVAGLVIGAAAVSPPTAELPVANLPINSPVIMAPTDATAVMGREDETCRGALWRVPVGAPVIDPFRLPSNPFGPGNRGIEYATAIGDSVAAVAAGQAIFSGSVGGNRFVVVRHDDGLKSTYGYLETSAVTKGQAVEQGQPIATAALGFHLTARRGETYIDPALLMAETCYVVRLVPIPN